MKFEDLSSWDLDLIRSNGIHTLAFTKVSDRYEAIAECTLNCIYAKGFDVFSLDSKSPKSLAKYVASCIPPKQSYGSTRNELTFEDAVREVFVCLQISKFSIVRSSRESTWSTPKESWYHRTDNVKKPWVF